MTTDTNTTPRIGDGASYTMWTDSYACTIVGIERNGKVLVLQRDKAVPAPDHGPDRQRWTFEADPEGTIFRVSRRKRPDGSTTWKTIGQDTKTPGGYATLGSRYHHHDYGF